MYILPLAAGITGHCVLPLIRPVEHMTSQTLIRGHAVVMLATHMQATVLYTQWGSTVTGCKSRNTITALT